MTTTKSPLKWLPSPETQTTLKLSTLYTFGFLRIIFESKAAMAPKSRTTLQFCNPIYSKCKIRFLRKFWIMFIICLLQLSSNRMLLHKNRFLRREQPFSFRSNIFQTQHTSFYETEGFFLFLKTRVAVFCLIISRKI